MNVENATTQRLKFAKIFQGLVILCSDTESPTAGGLFHKVKFGLRKAFFICFEMSSTSKGLSAFQISERYSIRQSTARLFMHKVREAMKSSEKHPMKGDVQTDEFIVGGKEIRKTRQELRLQKEESYLCN